MQSECTAASPQPICSYAWKMPPARPAIFERAQKLISRSEAYVSQGEQRSVPWKAYLASREFQHLASDIAEAIFAAAPVARLQGAARPVSLTLGSRTLLQEGEPLRGLLAAALPEGAGAGSREPGLDALRRDLPKAA